jgi:hypothetical protein
MVRSSVREPLMSNTVALAVTPPLIHPLFIPVGIRPEGGVRLPSNIRGRLSIYPRRRQTTVTLDGQIQSMWPSGCQVRHVEEIYLARQHLRPISKSRHGSQAWDHELNIATSVTEPLCSGTKRRCLDAVANLNSSC